MDKALKQRLVGASVLIILAVIVLPMLLSGRSDTLKHESSQIELPPKPDELSIETRRFPVGVPSRPAPATTQEPDQDNVTDAAQEAQAGEDDLVSAGVETVESSPQAETGSDEAPVATTGPDDMTIAEVVVDENKATADTVLKAPEVASITLSAAPDKNLEITEDTGVSENTPRYLVQVASFSNEKNANTLADVLKAEKLPVLLDVVDRPSGRMYRVRAGPYEKRPEADALVSSLRAKMSDLTPRVLDLRPDESAPVSTPSDPLVRWVVQVGSFSNSASAEDLVAKLRLAGLSAFSEKVSSAGGAVYKVRIGPELDRDRAAELARNVKAEHHLDAFVTTQE
ncbi:MAG TPA: SPOR domain-containing protein [Xanthomonadales bacterium]